VENAVPSALSTGAHRGLGFRQTIFVLALARDRYLPFHRGLLLFLAFWLAASPSGAGGEMPNGFLYLRDADPTILHDMRYASANNFVGKTLPGYEAPECVLVKQAAEALKAVQAELREKHLTLKVYDCYRPARAVKAFVDWAKLPADPQAASSYYPALEKRALFPDYIATVSSHSRGATVDLTIVPLDAPAEPTTSAAGGSAPCTAALPERAPDSSIDMGTSFDCFDVKAHTHVSGLAPEQRQNRQMLVDVMGRHGFKNYEKEWWHFTLEHEPYPDTIFDFPIEPRK
jgi:zinc D-Ala-D-Ala dipeptidase